MHKSISHKQKLEYLGPYSIMHPKTSIERACVVEQASEARCSIFGEYLAAGNLKQALMYIYSMTTQQMYPQAVTVRQLMQECILHSQKPWKVLEELTENYQKSEHNTRFLCLLNILIDFLELDLRHWLTILVAMLAEIIRLCEAKSSKCLLLVQALTAQLSKLPVSYEMLDCLYPLWLRQEVLESLNFRST